MSLEVSLRVDLLPLGPSFRGLLNVLCVISEVQSFPHNFNFHQANIQA